MHGTPDWVRMVQVAVTVENVPIVPEPATEYAAGGIDRKTTTSTSYQEVEKWTVASGKVGELKELILISNDFAHTYFKVTIGDITFCNNTIVRNVIPLVFADLKLAETKEVKVECKSTDGTSITVDAVIVGKEIG